MGRPVPWGCPRDAPAQLGPSTRTLAQPAWGLVVTARCGPGRPAGADQADWERAHRPRAPRGDPGEPPSPPRHRLVCFGPGGENGAQSLYVLCTGAPTPAGPGRGSTNPLGVP